MKQPQTDEAELQWLEDAISVIGNFIFVVIVMMLKTLRNLAVATIQFIRFNA